jgi:glyoxylase-like metal-dependent hydrolase (beta-lactamase superfamily II)
VSRAVDLVSITSTIWMLRFPVVQAYIARLDGAFALIDTGPPGSERDILEALARLGGSDQPLEQIVLTHCHKDHTGSAAAIARDTGATIVSGEADAAVIAGWSEQPAAALTETERPFYEKVAAAIPPAQPVDVDRVVRDGDDLAWSEPAIVIETPGHTPGGIAVHLPTSRVLFTGDTIASVAGTPILGPFNVDPDEARRSFRRLADLDVAIACFGHGEPILREASVFLQEAARQL